MCMHMWAVCIPHSLAASHAQVHPPPWRAINVRPPASLLTDNHSSALRRFCVCFLPKWNATYLRQLIKFCALEEFLWVCSFVGRAFRYFCVMKNITGVFDSLSTDMHSNQITSSSYHSLHKSQESPTLPVSTATDSSYYNNNQQAGQCAGSPYDQISSYQYQNNSMNSVQYNTKSYELGFGNAFGSYGTYGSCSSPTPADAGKYISLLLLLTWGNSL